MYHFDFDSAEIHYASHGAEYSIGGSPIFWSFKRLFDVVGSLTLLPFMLLVALVLWMINPIWNRGPVFFLQQRMGKDCQPFTAFKFRTMEPIDVIKRGRNDPVEHHCIT